jgi:uroporphyrinogen-III synthase
MCALLRPLICLLTVCKRWSLAQQFHCRELPVFGVGAATAAAAGDAGFHVIHESGGDVDLLAADVRKVCTPQAGALLHIAGSVVARDLGLMLQAQGFEVRKAVLYEAKARRGFSPAVAQALKGEDKETSLEAVVLYSPRTARIFKELIDKGGLLSEAQRLSAFCLSENVAKALNGLKLAKIQIADRPRQEDLLKCLDETSR